MEKGTYFERVIGGTQGEKEAVFEELQAVFEERNEELAKYELEKSSEDLEIIEKTESIVDKIVERYGGKPKAFPLDNIYILRPGSVLEMTEGKLREGIHKPLGLKIGIEKEKSRLSFAAVLAHELFHLKSYKSARVGKSAGDVRLYRSGLSMFDRKDENRERGEEKEYFTALEEAVVTECTKQFIDEIGKDSEFSEEIEAIEKFKKWVMEFYRRNGISEEKIEEFKGELKYIANPQDRVESVLAFSDNKEERQSYAAGMFKSLYEKGEAKTIERYRERKKMYELLDRLAANSDGKFKHRDEVFDEFAKANFSGNYLPLARMVENILGRGMFRKLAEEFGEDPKK